MKSFFIGLIACRFFWLPVYAQQAETEQQLKQLSAEIMKRGMAYENLRFLCKQIGHRISGSPQEARAVEAAQRMLKEAGADTVYLQLCMVPKWVRGPKEEAIATVAGNKKSLSVLALGMSVGTLEKGIEGDVIEAKTFEGFQQLPNAAVAGKIVFFNYPMQEELINGGYGDAVKYRGNGVVEAAKKGAIGVVIHSITHARDGHPHTGSLKYAGEVKKIPGFALSPLDAQWLSEACASGKKPKLWLKSGCRQYPDVPGYNVIGEIKGVEKPHEIVLAGGHLDSWDVGEGAHDDGAGCVQSIEVIRSIKAMGWKPKRTVRVVLFANEENGLRGGLAYLVAAKAHPTEKQVFAIESDAGGYGAETINLVGTDEQIARFSKWEPLLKPYGIYEISRGFAGSDINPLAEVGTLLSGVNPGSQRYFDLHHAPSDVFEAVNRRELHMGAFGMAAMCWLVSQNGVE